MDSHSAAIKLFKRLRMKRFPSALPEAYYVKKTKTRCVVYAMTYPDWAEDYGDDNHCVAGVFTRIGKDGFIFREYVAY